MPPTPITAGIDVDFQGVALRVRFVDGDLLFLEASNGSFFGVRHVTNVTVCPPPATPTAASLPAPVAGQGVGTLPAQIPYSETLWRFLTNGYGYSFVAGLDDGDRDKQFLLSQAHSNWDQIRVELERRA